MRALKIVCGIAVLFMSLHMVHAIHHFTHMKNEMPAGMWVEYWGWVLWRTCSPWLAAFFS